MSIVAPTKPGNWLYWALVFFLITVFAIGGGSRSDIQSLVILRPVAAVLVMVGFWYLAKEEVRANRFLFAFAGSLFALIIAHLIPFPAGLWQGLPGRELTLEIDRAVGLGQTWRPVSLVPAATWNAFFALLVPFAALLLITQIDREKTFDLLRVILFVGTATGLVGLFQSVGSPGGPLHFYRITNEDMAVGLFANRNHQAVFLATMLPMLAVFASSGSRPGVQKNWHPWAALVGGAVLIPLILVTGSRAGLIAAMVGLAASMLLYRQHPAPEAAKAKTGWRRYTSLIFIAATALFLGIITVLMARAEAINRLLNGNASEEQRLQSIRPILDAAWSYFPFGSGIGSFVEVYQVHEPAAALSFNYVNHAHNDWAEMLLTAGLPGLLLLGIALVAYARSTWAVFTAKNSGSRQIQFARLGAVIIFILGLASAADYPLRVPSLACLFVVAAFWLNAGAKAERTRG